MPTVTLSSKSQITLPADIVRALGLKAGDKLVAELIDDRIVLLPRPANWTEYFKGSTKGLWGTEAEIDRYIAEERGSRERDEWLAGFDDLVAKDEDVRLVVETLKSFSLGTATYNKLRDEIRKERTLQTGKLKDVLRKLVHHGGVREITLDGVDKTKYRLVHDFAAR